VVELYRETGHRPYLELASQWIEQRGHGLIGDSGFGRRYLQDHEPVRRASTEVGHVVRALYLEAGVVDVPAETGDAALLQTSVGRWADIVAAKTYLTGGNRSRHEGESLVTGSSCRRTVLTTVLTTRRARPSRAFSGPGGCCWPPAMPGTRTTWNASCTTDSRAQPPRVERGSST
jgi:hypothetical protein